MKSDDDEGSPTTQSRDDGEIISMNAFMVFTVMSMQQKRKQ